MTAPRWLREFQTEFARFLARPLDRSEGRLRSRDDEYPKALLARVVDAPPITAAARLGVYHRQYWYRLLDLLQKSFPVTTRLLGHYHFNEPAALFFAAHPPAARDLDRDADGFPAFFGEWAQRARPQEADYLWTGMALDRACRDIFAAPETAAWSPDAAIAARLGALRLRLSPERALYRESFPLIALRARIIAEPGESPWPRPERVAERAFLIARNEVGIAFAALELHQARLYELLCQYPVAEALSLWQSECGSGDAEQDARRTQDWLAKSMHLRLWLGAV